MGWKGGTDVDIILNEGFDGETFDERLSWHCAPARWEVDARLSALVLWTDGETDFWRETHYGFTADNGHFLGIETRDDFVMSAYVRFYPANQYDQAGLMVRLSPRCWLKTSVEYEPDGPGQLGVVVTQDGYSDWSTQPFPKGEGSVLLRVRREGDVYIVEQGTDGTPQPDSSTEGAWAQMRLARLSEGDKDCPVQCGVYACSPKGAGYRAEFDYLRIERGRLASGH